MGTIKQGILGGFSGSVAGVVGSSWKGIAVIKAKPLSVANPKTASQVGNRTAFKAAGQVGSKLLTNIVKPLWDRDAQRKSGFNAFVSSNKQAFSTLGVLDVTKYILTLGKLAASEINDFSIIKDQKNVIFSFVSGAGTGEKLTSDVAYAVAYNATKDEWAQSDGTAIRDDEEVTVSFESNMETGDVISGWLAFRSADGFNLFAPGSDLSNTVQ